MKCAAPPKGSPVRVFPQKVWFVPTAEEILYPYSFKNGLEKAVKKNMWPSVGRGAKKVVAIFERLSRLLKFDRT
jgi:hypothetical protein